MSFQESPIEQITKETIKRSFETSPDTVYGILVGILVVAIFYMAYRLSVKDRKLVELNVSTIGVLKDLNTSLLLLKEELEIKNRKHDEP